MSRLTRKEMKRDEVLDWMGRTVEYVRDNAQLLLSVAAVVVVAAGVVGGLAAYRGKQADRANRLLAEAIMDFDAQIDPISPDPEGPRNPTFADTESRNASASAKLAAVHEEFAGSPVGAVAAAYLGDLAADAGDVERAESLWREALEETSDSLLAGRIQLNLIRLARAHDRKEEAVEKLRALLGEADAPLPEDVLLFELADVLDELDRRSEAESAWERLVEEHDASPYAAEAQRRLDES